MLYFEGMKLKKKQGKTLESLTVFPYVAWALTFAFAYFVYQLAVDLQATAERLEAQTTALELRANTPVEEIEDFEAY